MMKYVFKHSILFLLAALVIYVTLVALGTALSLNGRPLYAYYNSYNVLPGGHTHQRYTDWSESDQNHFDVLVMGSSLAYRGYDPRIFEKHGYEMFNLGSSAQSFRETYLLLQTLPTDEEDLLIINTSPGSITSSGMESVLRLIPNVPSDSLAWQMMLHAADVKTFNEIMYRTLYFSDYIRPIQEDQEGGYVKNGYVMRTDSLKKRPKGTFGNRYDPGPEQKNYLKKIIEHVQVEALNCYFVIPPIPTYYDSKQKTAFKTDVQLMLNECSNCTLLDASALKAIDDKNHFSDYSHLNQEGVNRFNRYILNHIEN